nr:unnamed protein product [Fasciola hepatica]
MKWTIKLFRPPTKLSSFSQILRRTGLSSSVNNSLVFVLEKIASSSRFVITPSLVSRIFHRSKTEVDMINNFAVVERAVLYAN